MKQRFLSGWLAGAVAVSMVFPANADITAGDVRDQLFGYYESLGLQIDVGSEDMSGDTLSLNDLSLVFDIPDKDGEVVVDLGSFALRETGDGAVAIELPDTMDLTVSIVGKGEVKVVVRSALDFGSFEGLVSGSPDDLRIQSSASDAVFAVDSVRVEGEDIPASVNIGFGGIQSDYTIRLLEDGRRSIGGQYVVDDLGVLVNAKEQGGDGFFSLTANLASLASDFAVVAKPSDDPVEVLSAGIDISVQSEIGPSDMDVGFQSGSDRFAMTASTDGAELSMALSPDEVAYGFAENGVEMNIASSQIPVPAVKLGFENAEFSIRMPLAASGSDPSDFHVLAALRGLSVGEALWAMVDPTQTLPRDPATVAVDVSGKMMVLADLMNPETLATLENADGPPMLPVSVDLNELTAIFAGAALTGDGAFAFNFDDPKVVNGVPLPVGEANLTLTGGTGLLDKLSALGLVPPEASIGIRAMLGVFAKPMGEDHYESRIEVTRDGAVMANGQRIQ